MSKVSEIDFTDEDFKLIEDGLTKLSKYDSMGAAMAKAFLVSGDIPGTMRQQLEDSIKRSEAQSKREHQEKVDGITILRYKLVQFKRYLRQNAARPSPPDEPVGNEAETSVSAH